MEYHFFQANIPEKGMQHPRIVQFCIPVKQLPRNRSAKALAYRLQSALHRRCGHSKKVKVWKTKRHSIQGKPKHRVFWSPNNIKAGTLLNMTPLAEAY